MKKFISGLIIGAMISIIIVSAAASLTAVEASFPVFVNGVLFKSDKPIVAIDGSTYMPLKAIGDVLGIKVLWNNDLRRVEVGETPIPVTDVASMIKNKAVKDWPNDYQMQLYQIKNETEAYNLILALPSTIDYNSTILTKAIADWPGDYQMQLYQYNQELKAYNKINN